MTNSKALRFSIASTNNEWKMVRYFRQKYFFDCVPIDDPYTWTFEHPMHVHFVLYIQLWPEKRAAMRIIVIDELYRHKGLGGLLLKHCESWLLGQKVKTLLVQAFPASYKFYCNNGYVKMPFNDPDGYESDPQDIEVGKHLYHF
jgi:GNAT superfamily N-acetyltransferase